MGQLVVLWKHFYEHVIAGTFGDFIYTFIYVEWMDNLIDMKDTKNTKQILMWKISVNVLGNSFLFYNVFLYENI